MPGDISINEIISNALSHRDLAVHEAEQKKREMWEKIPELGRIDNILVKTGSRIMSASLSGGDIESKISDIERENAELLDKKKMLLVSRGIAPDYDEPQFDCKKCNDTGYTDDGRLCACIRKKANELLCAQSGLGKNLSVQSFDNFSLSYYSNTSSRAENGITERENMQNILSVCREAAEQIGERCINLLLMGGTGLGKTHLSTALAREVISRGYSVLYDSAQSIFEEYEANHFNRRSSDVERFERTQLLIIDDLGAEFITQFSAATFCNLVNKRQISGLSTVISTNLLPKELKKNYGDRMTSRLFGDYTVLRFFGRDIRMLKMESR